MMILSDCITDKADEGCLKVANILTERMKAQGRGITVVSYKRNSPLADVHLRLNKLFLNFSLFALIKSRRENILYIPFSSNTMASVVRTWILSCMTNGEVKVIFVLCHPMNIVTKKLLKASKAQVIALSQESYEFYKREIGNAVYIRTGVDTTQYAPVDHKRKMELRKKYRLPADKKVVLHVGHLKYGRGIDSLLDVEKDFCVVLVLSSASKAERDHDLEQKLKQRPNIIIIDSYQEHMEELYQMADVYFFPVREKGHCIDVPLSVLEAAACNIPIVTTAYGELKAFRERRGFKFIADFSAGAVDSALHEMAALEDCKSREAVMDYDWNAAAERLLEL